MVFDDDVAGIQASLIELDFDSSIEFWDSEVESRVLPKSFIALVEQVREFLKPFFLDGCASGEVVSP